MARSYRPGLTNPWETRFHTPSRTPGVLGLNDHGDPNVTTLLGDTPGPLGINDFADTNLKPKRPITNSGKYAEVRGNHAIVLAEGFSKNEKKIHKVQTEKVPLGKAQETALRITTYFEGGKSMNYQALADNFDGQGTSFGLIQWNFGQNTLGPLLNKMRLQDSVTFEKCFSPDAHFEAFEKALVENNKAAQIAWVSNLLTSNRAAWKATFNAIGSVEAFNRIQRTEALANYHPLVVKAISSVRSIEAGLMQEVEVRSYVALFDLCVQQHGLTKALDAIKARVKVEQPESQLELMKIVVVERAKKASSQWASDCISRRIGILQGSAYESTENKVTKKRNNPELTALYESGSKNVEGL